MAFTFEELKQKLMDQGIDPEMADSLAKSAIKGTAKKTPARKRASGEPRAKKYVGRFKFTEICQTCGSTTTRTLITEIDPNKPRSTEVPVSICNACIPNYRKMTQDQLIGLIILKDHPNLELRLLNNKQQIRMAKLHTPTELMNIRLDVAPAPDKRYLKPEYDAPEVDFGLVKECQLIYNKAFADLGPELGGHALVDLLADNTNASLSELRAVLPYIKKHVKK